MKEMSWAGSDCEKMEARSEEQMIGFTNANQALWAIGRLLLFISTSSLTGKCSQLRRSRCACPCMILRSSQSSHLRAGNRDEETRAAREPSQPDGLTENWVYAGSWADWERAAQRGHATLTPRRCSEALATLPEEMQLSLHSAFQRL